MRSPALFIGRAALWLCVPAEEADAIAGDLAEEYFADRLPRWGERRANRWYLSQALRSAIPLLVTRWRRGELAGLTLAAMAAIFVPLRLADLLWAFVHSRIPLKAGLAWESGFWIANLAIALAGSAVLSLGVRDSGGRQSTREIGAMGDIDARRETGARLSSRDGAVRESITIAILVCVCAAASVVTGRGEAPGWYVEALLIGVVVSVGCVGVFKGRRISW